MCVHGARQLLSKNCSEANIGNTPEIERYEMASVLVQKPVCVCVCMACGVVLLISVFNKFREICICMYEIFDGIMGWKWTNNNKVVVEPLIASGVCLYSIYSRMKYIPFINIRSYSKL